MLPPLLCTLQKDRGNVSKKILDLSTGCCQFPQYGFSRAACASTDFNDTHRPGSAAHNISSGVGHNCVVVISQRIATVDRLYQTKIATWKQHRRGFLTSCQDVGITAKTHVEQMYVGPELRIKTFDFITARRMRWRLGLPHGKRCGKLTQTRHYDRWQHHLPDSGMRISLQLGKPFDSTTGIGVRTDQGGNARHNDTGKANMRHHIGQHVQTGQCFSRGLDGNRLDQWGAEHGTHRLHALNGQDRMNSRAL